MQALERAVKIAGGQTALAEKIGKTQPQIAMWLKRRTVDPTACIPIETATDGAVTRYDLRPDVFGPPPTTATTPQQDEAA